MPVTEKESTRLTHHEKKNTYSVSPAARYWESYSKFIELTAHDLRAPLRKLGVLTDRLIDKYKLTADEEVDQYTHRIHTCIAEMQSLIDAFSELALTTPDSLEYGTCDTNDLVRRLLAEFSTRIKEKQATVKINDLPVLRADPHQLRALFRELIENAILFSKPDTPLKIELYSEKVDDSVLKDLSLEGGRTWHRITVSDNGIGMEPGETDRIFQPLVRLHGRAGYPGNGLGLALVKRIVDNHGGIIYAESKPGEGTQINIILPENTIE